MTYTKPKPGFVRVLIQARNKTIQIRESHARDQGYLNKHGMTVVNEPISPPTLIGLPLMPPEPIVYGEVEKPKQTRNRTKSN